MLKQLWPWLLSWSAFLVELKLFYKVFGKTSSLYVSVDSRRLGWTSCYLNTPLSVFLRIYSIFILFLLIAFNGNYGLLDCTPSFFFSEENLVFSFDVLFWLHWWSIKFPLPSKLPGRCATAFAHAEFSKGGRGAYSSDGPNQATADYQSVMGVVDE